jgi:hypothetical protein
MTLPDQPLRVTDTNSAIDFAGTIFGIALPLFRYVIAALLAGFLVFLALQGRAEVSITGALMLAFAPALVCAVVLALLFQGKPPSHAADMAESLLNQGHASPLSSPK